MKIISTKGSAKAVKCYTIKKPGTGKELAQMNIQTDHAEGTVKGIVFIPGAEKIEIIARPKGKVSMIGPPPSAPKFISFIDGIFTAVSTTTYKLVIIVAFGYNEPVTGTATVKRKIKNLEMTVVLDGGWKSGTASGKFLVKRGEWKSFSNYEVKKKS